MLTLFSAQVFSRVTRVSFADVAAFKVTGWELLAAVTTVALISDALVIGGITMKQWREWGIASVIGVVFLAGPMSKQLARRIEAKRE